MELTNSVLQASPRISGFQKQNQCISEIQMKLIALLFVAVLAVCNAKTPADASEKERQQKKVRLKKPNGSQDFMIDHRYGVTAAQLSSHLKKGTKNLSSTKNSSTQNCTVLSLSPNLTTLRFTCFAKLH